jgi:transcriptional regulator with GAF, ATPase, and Fis domain
MQSVIERAVILGNGRCLDVQTALGSIATTSPPAPQLSPPSLGTSNGGLSTLDVAMKKHIEEALAASKGRVEGPYGAALLLGINPHTLRARMRKLGVAWRSFRKKD